MLFKSSRFELTLISQIADRAIKEWKGHGLTKQNLCMDLDAVHSNGCQLDLVRMLNGNVLDFGHDIFGIRHHLDRETGKLGDHFVPRYALRVTATEKETASGCSS